MLIHRSAAWAFGAAGRSSPAWVRGWCGGCDGLLQVFGVAMVAVMMVVR
jgi:hypothetical protein